MRHEAEQPRDQRTITITADEQLLITRALRVLAVVLADTHADQAEAVHQLRQTIDQHDDDDMCHDQYQGETHGY
jgi:hypothetical protein